MPRAGLTPSVVADAGATLADEVGADQLSMGELAKRLKVKTPSLYKHVESMTDLNQRIAIVAMTELADAIRDATQGRAGRDALIAAANALRHYVKQHPGRYEIANRSQVSGADDLLAAAGARVLDSLSAVLRHYDLKPHDEIHALRTLRSVLHGFSVLDAAGGFALDTDTDESFTWMIDIIDSGLKSSRQDSTRR